MRCWSGHAAAVTGLKPRYGSDREILETASGWLARGERTLLGESSLPEGAAVNKLHVGVQAFTSAPTIRFDDLRFAPIPEPSTLCLFLLGAPVFYGLRSVVVFPTNKEMS